MKHYSEVDLLEVHYLPAAELVPVHKHLSSCPECMSRYDTLQKKLRASIGASCGRIEQKPQTFWDRQRFSIMRKIQEQPRQISRPSRSYAWVGIAAALIIVVALALILGQDPSAGMRGSAAPEVATVESQEPLPEIDAAADVFQELRAVNDPWSSDELSGFRGAVEWETWTTEPARAAGGTL